MVRGEFVRLDPARLEDALGSLDGLEGYCPEDEAGSPCVRRVVEAHLDSGAAEHAHVYYLNREAGELTVIASGEWTGPVDREDVGTGVLR